MLAGVEDVPSMVRTSRRLQVLLDEDQYRRLEGEAQGLQLVPCSCATPSIGRSSSPPRSAVRPGSVSSMPENVPLPPGAGTSRPEIHELRSERGTFLDTTCPRVPPGRNEAIRQPLWFAPTAPERLGGNADLQLVGCRRPTLRSFTISLVPAAWSSPDSPSTAGGLRSPRSCPRRRFVGPARRRWWGAPRARGSRPAIVLVGHGVGAVVAETVQLGPPVLVDDEHLAIPRSAKDGSLA